MIPFGSGDCRPLGRGRQAPGPGRPEGPQADGPADPAAGCPILARRWDGRPWVEKVGGEGVAREPRWHHNRSAFSMGRESSPPDDRNMPDIATVLYNVVMAGVDLAALAVVWRGQTVARWAASSRLNEPVHGGSGATADLSGGDALGLLARTAGRASSGFLSWAACMACSAVVAVVLAGVASKGHAFAAMRLLAWGVFLHGPVLLIGSAVAWGRTYRLMAVGCGAVAVVLLAVAADAFLVEPTWLEVSRREIRSSKIHRPIRIVVLADLQTDQVGPYEREVLRRALQEKPDLILLAGDYVQADEARRAEVVAQVNSLIAQDTLPGPDRVFAIRGNVDWDDWAESFRDTPVVVVDSTDSFDLDGALEDVRLTCLGLRDSVNTSLEVAGDADRFHIVVGHSPEFARGHIEADLLVAGHTHGGQVRLPLVGPVMVFAAVPRSWAAGWTDLPGGGRLLVSRGVGMERGQAPRLRFLCRPELVVIDLLPEEAP